KPLVLNCGMSSEQRFLNAQPLLLPVGAVERVVVAEELLRLRLQSLPRRIPHHRVEARPFVGEYVGELQPPVEEALALAQLGDDRAGRVAGRVQFARQRQRVELVERPEPERAPGVECLADAGEGGVGLDAFAPDAGTLVRAAGGHRPQLAVEASNTL